MDRFTVHSLNDHPSIPLDSVICLGFFDGLHRGHQALIRYAQSFHKPVLVLTFDRNPKWNRPDFLLTPPNQRAALLETLGVKGLIELTFNDDIRQAHPVAFIRFLQALKPYAVISGSDFKFGYHASGDVTYLKNDAKTFEVLTFNDVKEGMEKISSSRIIQLLEEGQLSQVQSLIGRPYAIQGTVGHGFKKGRTIGYPTANITIKEPYFLPKTGVYLTEILVKGHWYAGMANLGFHPTVNALTDKTLEVHIFDFDESIYDQLVEVRFLERLRDEQKFTSLEALKTQLKEDELNARKLYQSR